MKENSLNHTSHTPIKTHIASFTLKALVVLILLNIFGSQAESLDPIVLACVWASVSSIFAITLMYPYVIKKYNTKEMYLDGSRASGVINGRTIRFILCFALSAFLVASLMIASQKWTLFERIAVLASVPLYIAISLLVDKHISKKEYKPLYQRRGTLLISWVITGLIVTLFYFGITLFVLNGNYSSLGEAFSGTALLFNNSPSALLSETGKINYLIEGCAAYALSQLNGYSGMLYLIITLILCASSSFAIVHLLSLCSLEPSELKKVFLPIEEKENAKFRKQVIAKSSGALLALFAFSIGLFMYLDHEADTLRQTNEYSMAQEFVREQANLSAYEIDGKKYDSGVVDKTISETFQDNPELDQARNELISTITEVYQTCTNNIDSYIEWRFDPFTQAQKFFEGIVNPNENRAKQELSERITDGIDFNKLEACIETYNELIDDAELQVIEKLSKQHLHEIPDWLAVKNEPLEEYFDEMRLDASLPLDIQISSYNDAETCKSELMNALEANRSELLGKIPSLPENEKAASE